jgi:hypothetical protein
VGTALLSLQASQLGPLKHDCLSVADGVVWTDITAALNVSIVGLAAGNGTVIAAAYEGTVYSTSDGTNWAVAAANGSNYLGDCAVFCAPSVFFVSETYPPT